MNYYLLSFNNSYTKTIAYSPKGSPQPHHLISQIDSKQLNEFPFDMKLHSAAIGKSGIEVGDISDEHTDIQPNNLAWPLMSLRLKEIIDSSLTGNESLTWISIKLVGKTKDYTYFLPFFSDKRDILDIEHSIFVGPWNTLLKPYFKSQKVKTLAFFNGDPNNWQVSSRLYVNDLIKKKIEQSGITGISFTKARMT